MVCSDAWQYDMTLYKMKVAIVAVLIFSTTDSLKWIVNTNPIMFGDSVSLLCIVTENTCPENYVRRWVGGPRQTLISLNYKSTDSQKYNMSRIHNSTSFELIIYKFNENDLECEYTCSCGFEQFSKTLSLFDNKLEFTYPLNHWKINETISLKKQQLSVHLSIDKVYPLPECRLVLNDIVVLQQMNLTENYTNDKMLPTVTVVENITLNTSVCDVGLSVKCRNRINSTFLLVLQKRLSSSKCGTEIATSHNRLDMVLYVVFPVCGILLCVLAFLVVERGRALILLFIYYNCRNNNYRHSKVQKQSYTKIHLVERL